LAQSGPSAFGSSTDDVQEYGSPSGKNPSRKLSTAAFSSQIAIYNHQSVEKVGRSFVIFTINRLANIASSISTCRSPTQPAASPRAAQSESRLATWDT